MLIAVAASGCAEGGRTDSTSPGFQALVAPATAYAHTLRDPQDLIGAGTVARFQLENADQTVRLETESGRTVEGPAQVIGVWLPEYSAFAWGWASGYDPRLLQVVERVRTYGETNGIPELVAPGGPMTRAQAMDRYRVALMIVQAEEAYRLIADDGEIWLATGELTEAGSGK